MQVCTSSQTTTPTSHHWSRAFSVGVHTKPWLLSGLKWLIKKIDDTRSTEQVTCTSQPCTMRCDDNTEHVEQLALSQEDKPGTHSTRTELNISCTTMRRILHNDLRFKCFKKCRSMELSEANDSHGCSVPTNF